MKFFDNVDDLERSGLHYAAATGIDASSVIALMAAMRAHGIAECEVAGQVRLVLVDSEEGEGDQ